MSLLGVLCLTLLFAMAAFSDCENVSALMEAVKENEPEDGERFAGLLLLEVTPRPAAGSRQNI